MDFFKNLFESDFMPHGHCYFWKPAVLWTNVLGDAAIALSYFLIPILLFRFLKRREDVKFRWVFGAFATFILACGCTHLIAIISVWYPMYRLEGLVKVVTAIVSLSTLGALFYLFPVILGIPTPEQWKAAKQDLLQSQERFKLMMQNAPIGMAVTSTDGDFVEVNEALCKLFKYESEKFQNMSFIDVTHPDFLQQSQHATKLLSEGKEENIHMEKKYIRSDGSSFWALVNLAPMESEPYNIVQIVDITDQKNSELQVKNLNRELENKVSERTEALEEINKDLENFIYAVTHDLRVPLHNLEGLTKIVMEDLADLKGKEDAKYALSMISENAFKMDELVVDLLAFCQAGQYEINKDEIDVAKKMQEVFDDLQPRYKDHKIDFKINELPKAKGDKTAIRQVCQNLISNALKYSSTQSHSRIEVGGEELEDKVVFWVKDNGIGFEQKYEPKLFHLFHRLHTAEEFEGTGLGLAASMRLIKKHGGNMWAEGKPGEGAVFYFSLPK